MAKSILSILIILMMGLQVPGELKVVVTNIHPLEGELYVAIYQGENTYMDIEQATDRRIVKIENTSETIIFTGLEQGEYAVAIFQDMNGNGELDVNALGFPSEPFGFSNNAKPKMGPPKYKKASFAFSGNKEMNISMLNNDKK